LRGKKRSSSPLARQRTPDTSTSSKWRNACSRKAIRENARKAWRSVTPPKGAASSPDCDETKEGQYCLRSSSRGGWHWRARNQLQSDRVLLCLLAVARVLRRWRVARVAGIRVCVVGAAVGVLVVIRAVRVAVVVGTTLRGAVSSSAEMVASRIETVLRPVARHTRRARVARVAAAAVAAALAHGPRRKEDGERGTGTRWKEGCKAVERRN